MNIDEWLDFVEGDDELGLLKEKAKAKKPTADETLVNGFNEICDFVTANGKEPTENRANVSELMLFKRLSSIRGNDKQSHALIDFDIHGLLPITQQVAEPSAEYKVEQRKIESIDDIFDDDDLGLLDDDADSIFTIRNVPKTIDMPSRVAKRKRCKDFEKYEPLFKQCHDELKDGEREALQFTGEQQIQKGQYFILHGIMCYVSDMGEREKKNGKINARLHLIFENGTESDMLLRSLATELYKDETGRRVMPKLASSIDELAGITEDDQATGYIYILQSLSENLDIKDEVDLYKIGYSTTSIEKRIANAAKEPTYLMAPVKIVAGYQCYNMNAQKFENLIHTFFGKACLDIEIADERGQLCRPREWFIAPLKSIEMAIQLLINGEIVHYRYDKAQQDVVER